MIETFSAISFMAETVCRTVRPLSSASLAPLTAICSVWRLFSAFCEMEALICSRLEVVSSTEAACSLVPCESVCEVAETCPAAEARALAPLRTSPMMRARLSPMSRMAESSRPISSLRLTSMRSVRSPWAMRWAACSVTARGSVMLRVMRALMTRLARMASAITASIEESTVRISAATSWSSLPMASDSWATHWSVDSSRRWAAPL